MKNKPDKQSLFANYQLIDEMDLNNPIPFLLRELNYSGPVIKFFRAALFLFFLLLVYEFFKQGFDNLPTSLIPLIICLPVLILVLMPVHELIHGLAFFICGARKIKFKPLWRKMAIYTLAPGFISGKNENFFIGSLPFVVISVSLIAIYLFLPPHRFFVAGLLFTHTYCCLGDAMILSFLIRVKNKEVYSFDDLAKNRTYFFAGRE